jgi:nitroreductase
MPTTPVPQLDRRATEAALAVAVRAPSIHNTQPWRWQLADGVLTLRADRSRQLAVADPDGHSLLISCGAALHLTELALRAAGW